MLDVVESRYDRQERIWWWDQQRLLDSRVLVVGAGALGNEIVKNLVLVGVGAIDVIDMDTIDSSNLSRCVFFRHTDTGRAKAEVLAERAGELNPDVHVRAIVAPVQTLGSGFPLAYDLVIAGLDNREARLWLNGACRRLGRYWIDGAIEGLQGLVRVFGPEGACYECTLSEADLANLSHRRSCALLTPDDLVLGRTPTNATSSSIVAGVEAQEAIKLLVGREDLVALTGRVWRFEGESMLNSTIEYVPNDDCYAHERLDSSPQPVGTIASLQELAEGRGPTITAIDLFDDLLCIGPCRQCGTGDELLGLRGMVPPGAGRCSTCQGEREVAARTSLEPGHPWLSTPMSSMWWTRAEVVGLRSDKGTDYVLIEGTP